MSSNDVTYRFLICRTATLPKSAAARNQTRELAFGASAFFILSDGTEAQTSVNLSFGDGVHPVESSPEKAPPATSPARPSLTRPGRGRLAGGWQTAAPRLMIVDAGMDPFRLRFSPQTWAGKIRFPELLHDQKLSSLQGNGPREGVDYCVWQPGDPNLVDRLLADPPDADVDCSFDALEKSSLSVASVVFALKARSGTSLGKLQCYFPRAESIAEISIDRWVSVVGAHLTLEIRR